MTLARWHGLWLTKQNKQIKSIRHDSEIARGMTEGRVSGFN
jgi:hypothetical protein